MKKLVTLLVLLPVLLFAQPTIDGTFDGEATWGTPKYTADGTSGWASANAKKVYVTNDASYIYVGAEITASDWMAWCFIFNSKSGGASSDSWGRNITNTHSNLPDYALRGNLNSGWSEINIWNGSVWEGNGVDIGTTEHRDNITGADITGWIEARILRATITELTGDIQFFITGNSVDHGSFDACPNDDNSTNWSGAEAHSDLVNYISAVPLPVELTSFSASVKNKAVNLVWHTATEVNNYGFEIEKTSPRPSPYQGEGGEAGSGWVKVGFVKGSGNSNSANEYSYTDKTVATGKYIYRLKQIDNDGKYEYSKEVEVDLGKPTTFALNQNYPNPFNPTTSIQYSVIGSQYVSLKVFNVLGKEVAVLVNEKQEPGVYTVNFSSANLSGGVYLYRLQAGDFVQTKKMILLK